LWDGNGTQVKAFPALADVGLRVGFSETDGYVLAGDWTGSLKVWKADDATERAVLVTNPQPLAGRLDDAKKAAAIAQAAAADAAAKFTALQKAATEKKSAVESASKAAADAQL